MRRSRAIRISAVVVVVAGLVRVLVRVLRFTALPLDELCLSLAPAITHCFAHSHDNSLSHSLSHTLRCSTPHCPANPCPRSTPATPVLKAARVAEAAR